MSQESVTNYPLRVYWSGEQKGYWRRSGVTARAQCPVERDAAYTVAPDGATAMRVFIALDVAIGALQRGQVPFQLECGGSRSCPDGLAQLRSIARRVSAITPQSKQSDTVYYVSGDPWGANLHFDGERLARIRIYRTPPPPVY